MVYLKNGTGITGRKQNMILISHHTENKFQVGRILG